jgi:hypothetical protein
MMWQFGFATIWAFTQIRRGQRIMCATHVALGARDFTLRNGHRSFFHSASDPHRVRPLACEHTNKSPRFKFCLVIFSTQRTDEVSHLPPNPRLLP